MELGAEDEVGLEVGVCLELEELELEDEVGFELEELELDEEDEGKESLTFND